jgi:hypothetical protein
MKRNIERSDDGTLDPTRPVPLETMISGGAAPDMSLAASSTVAGKGLLAAVLTAVVATPSLSTAQEAHEGKSADEIAKELANPNNSLASLTFKNQFRWYKGDLPDADDQSNYTLLFQPVFPFPLEPTASGGKPNIFVRPAIPLLVDQPVPTVDDGTFDWDDTTAMGDWGFDLAYGVTEKSGLLWAVGMVGTLPLATDPDVAGKQLRLGPEVLFAQSKEWGLYGIFPSHQWDVTGWGEGKDNSFSTTSIQPIFKYLPGGGWAVGSLPIMTYDWITDDWTIPLQLDVSKTVKWGNTPVKLELEINYYVEQPDPFGPEWMIGFNITPVVPNFINNWIRGN